MCGVAGILASPQMRDRPDGRVRRVEAVGRMISTLRHRGPDAQAVWSDDTIALGHARLSIIDLAETGAQPMHGRCGSTIAYNGECYNFRELRRELSDHGREFRGHSDTEVVLAAYETWGLEGLRRLEGMFAIALWDSRMQRLILMRDRLGIKPLYVANTDAGLVFGSEIKAILAAGGVDDGIDPQAFREYLWYGASQDDRSIYAGIRAVPPGHWMCCEAGRQVLEPWWRVEEWLERPGLARSYADAVRTVRHALGRSVERQLVADVPVGIFLSGGVDSSAIAAAAVRVGARDVMCYTTEFDDPAQESEVGKATAVAQHLGLPISRVNVGPQSLVHVVEDLARMHDEPFADAANIPLYLMCQALGGRAKVVLQGDGGDEVFGGYRRYTILRHASWARIVPRAPLAILRHVGAPGRRVARILDAATQRAPGMDMALLLSEDSMQAAPERVLRADVRGYLEAHTDPFQAYRRAALRFATQDRVQRMLLTDLTVQLPALYFAKVDRATMAAGIEARVPLLDEILLREVIGLPSEWKVHGLQKKRLLRDAMRGDVPDAILDAPKAGFGVPIGRWLRGPLHGFAVERLTDAATIDTLGLDRRVVLRLLTDHGAGKGNSGYLLWRLLQLALWVGNRAYAGRLF